MEKKIAKSRTASLNHDFSGQFVLIDWKASLYRHVLVKQVVNGCPFSRTFDRNVNKNLYSNE